MLRDYADNSTSGFDRRRHVRQRVAELAYVDIGTDNGGIVLNLSEEGMGFQAAVPLDPKTETKLRVQLPNIRQRLEIVAEIIWLGPGNQQAGVHFLDVSSEAQVQLQDWIRGQIPPDSAPQGSLPRITEAIGSSRKQEPIPEARKNKWLSLMDELEEQKRLLENRMEIGASAEIRPADSVADEKLPCHEVPRNLMVYSGHKETPVRDAISKQSSKEEILDEPDTRILHATGDNHIQKDSRSSAEGTGNSQLHHTEILNWPIPASKIVPISIPENALMHSEKSEKSADPPASITETDANVAAIRASAMAAPLTSTRSSHTREWVVAAVLLTSISFLFFGIGTWIGHTRRNSSQAQPPAGAIVAVPDNESARDFDFKEKGSEHAKFRRAEIPRGDARTTPTSKNRQAGVTATPRPPVLNSTPIPTLGKEGPLTTTKLPDDKLKPDPPKDSSAISAAAREPESKPDSVPVPQSSDSSPAVQRIVAGRKLRPADRFNPCHLSYRVEPEYPLEAKQQRIEGTVRIHQVIGADGRVQSVNLISGPPILVPAAMDAAKYWRYIPALLNGNPVTDEQDIEFDFRLPR